MIEYLITAYKNSKKQIEEIISNNPDYFLTIRNQYPNESFETNKCKYLTSNNDIGVSKNRNELLLSSVSEIIVFFDSDVIIDKKANDTINQAFKKYPDADVIRFLISSSNPKRPITQRFAKEGKSKYKDLSSTGIVCLAFKRDSLIKHNLFFDENFGPGTNMPCGEDSLFIKQLFKNKLKIYNYNNRIAIFKQDNSSWFTGTLTNEILNTKGIVFKKLYGNIIGTIAIIRYIFINRKNIKASGIKKPLSLMLKSYDGKKKYKN